MLFALVDGDDKYEEHLQAVEEEFVSTSAGNTFKMPLTNEYGDMDADADLVNTFDSLVSNDADHYDASCLNDEKTSMGLRIFRRQCILRG